VFVTTPNGVIRITGPQADWRPKGG
jgi:hypothetical protein